MTHSNLSRCRALLAALLCTGGSALHAQVSVGAGSTMALGNGTLDQGCLPLAVDGNAQVQGGQWAGIGDLAVGAAGLLDGGSGVVSLSGDFARSGGFAAGTGSVRLVDGCGKTTSSFGAGNGFYTLEVSTALGRTLVLPAGASQAVGHRLALAGAAGGLLQLRSSTAGQAAFTDLQPGAGQSIAYVDVADNHATGQAIAPGPAVSFHSVKGGNVQRWFDDVGPAVAAGARPVPALGPWGVVLAGLSVVLAVVRRRRFFGL